MPSVVRPGNKVSLRMAVGVSAPFLMISASISSFSLSVHKPLASLGSSGPAKLLLFLEDGTTGVLCTVGGLGCALVGVASGIFCPGVCASRLGPASVRARFDFGPPWERSSS